ncbi:uncharacterized protein LOC124448167 [Xenia sp. Carnegie-2017]|uniref:uncharacterized protein LOC124448167 n=1 Tax=Xenia sp. Carnegie-2017 TaxID=2897299 RepID=UPI001F04688F|nr:uncharacterized protein LOC124448167 [Xenia sp. Carnegie-2017]
MDTNDSYEFLSDHSVVSDTFPENEQIMAYENMIQPYSYEPVEIDSGSDADDDSQGTSAESSIESGSKRLQDKYWCTCGHCQIMDRHEECICCKEIAACRDINEESAEFEGIDVPECITDNPVFQNLCLNYWVLRLAWSQYKQQYGKSAFEGPEHKRQRHVAYRQFVRWCWGILGKEIRNPLPSCAVCCIRAYFPPPGLEEDFVFKGFEFADE